MLLLIIVVLTVCLIVAIQLERNLYCPAVVFDGVWLVVTVLYSLRLYDLYAVSERTLFYVLLGVLAFNGGFLLGHFMRYIRLSVMPLEIASVHSTVERFDVNYKLLNPAYLVVLLFTAYLSKSSIGLLLSGTSMEVIRFNYANLENGMVIRSALAWRFEMYVVSAFEFAAVALLPVVLFQKKTKENIILTSELILFLILHMFVTGARSFLIDIVILFAIYMLMNFEIVKRKFIKPKKIPKKVIFLLVVCAVLLVIAMTALRKGDKRDSSLLREIYRYFAISYPLFDRHLRISEHLPHTYGWELIYGLVRPPFSMLRSVGLHFPEGLNEVMMQINANDEFYEVGGGKSNSFVTVFYYHYMDFGVISMVLYSLLYGFVSQAVYNAMKRNTSNLRVQTFYLIIAIGLFLTFARSLFAAYRYVYALMVLAFSFRRSRRVEIPFV